MVDVLLAGFGSPSRLPFGARVPLFFFFQNQSSDFSGVVGR